MAEFITPAFLQNNSTQEIFEKMKSIIPEDIDLSEDSHTWNFTYPTALVVSEVCEFILPEVIRLIFPTWSYGDFLDGHAKARGITRRPSTAATGSITITGAVGTVIPLGSLFATAAVNDEPSVDYETVESAEIPDSGTVDVSVKCTQTGTIGNAGVGTVVLVGSRITGITAVTNPEEITGGTEEEDDATLISRIENYDQSQGDNFVGSASDYKRWAMSVPGVGEATVIPAQDDTGLVTIIITDANGAAATEDLCDSVYNYIMRPDAPYERLAPVNANLSVVPPSTTEIGIQATIELEPDATIESVRIAFLAQLNLYLPVAMDEQEIKYTRVAACLSAATGVADFKDLKIGAKSDGSITYGTANIPVTTTQLPTVSEDDLLLTTGTV